MSNNILPNPESRVEQYLANLTDGTTEIPKEPESRIEQYLDYLAKNGGAGVNYGTAPAAAAGMALVVKTIVDGKVTEWEFGDAGGLKIHICTSSEYGQVSREPVISSPDEKTLYLVPSENGSSPDLFVEWAYVNNNWEMFGSASIGNDYVTPQMYGAIGNGIADDTNALQAAFDSGKNVRIPEGTYLTSGVTISRYMRVFVEGATIKASTLYQDYVISISNKVDIFGQLVINGDVKAFNGLIISNANGSHYGYIDTQYCLAWGVNIVSGGHQIFDYIHTVNCGRSIDVTVSCLSQYVLNIDSELTDLNIALLSSEYFSPSYLYDKSNFSSTFPGVYFKRLMEFDAENMQFKTGSLAADRVDSNYVSKAAAVCFGGGVHLGRSLAKKKKIGILDTRMGGAGIGISANYGHSVDNFYSQSDTIPVCVYYICFGNHYGSVTFEGSKCGYNFISYQYDYSIISVRSTGYGKPYTAKESISLTNGASFRMVPSLSQAVAMRAIPYVYHVPAALTLYDSDSDTVIIKSASNVILRRTDLFAGTSDVVPWGAKILYFLHSTTSGDITISLHQTLIDDGYSITNGTNGQLVFTKPSAQFKVIVALVNKVFTMYIETLTPVTASS